MKLILFADLHLDAQFGWASSDVARKRRRILADALSGVVALAEEVRADAVLCGGDLYEHDRCSPDTAELVRSTFEYAHPLPVYLAPGNHDWYGKKSLYSQIDWSPNVHVFKEAALRPVELVEGLNLWGAAHRAPANTANFLERFRVDRDGVNLALFHGSERSGFVHQSGGKTLHAAFEAAQIGAAGLDHAFLGHYHSPKDAVDFTYPGNPAPLTFGEHEERGAVVVQVSEAGNITRQRRKVTSEQMHDLRIDVSGYANTQELRRHTAAFLSGLSGVARLTLEGELAADFEVRPENLEDVAPQMETVTVRVGAIRRGYDFDAIAQEPTVRGQFVRDVLAAELPEDERRRVLISGLRALDGREDLEVV